MPSNVVKLIIHKMALKAVPSGGGLADAIKFLSSKEGLLAGAREAGEWVKAAILAVRQASEPNPWKDASDEEIAGEILRQAEAKKASRRPSR